MPWRVYRFSFSAPPVQPPCYYFVLTHLLLISLPLRLWILYERFVVGPVEKTQLCLVLQPKLCQRLAACVVEDPLGLVEIDDQIHRLVSVRVRVDFNCVCEARR